MSDSPINKENWAVKALRALTALHAHFYVGQPDKYVERLLNTLPAPDFQPRGLEVFLKSHISGLAGPMVLERVGGGQSNPTYFVSFDNRRMVLRKKPAGELLPLAHAVDREHRVLTAMGKAGIAVPATVLYHDEPDIVGTPFYIMDRVDGRIFHDSHLPGAPRGQRREMYLSVARLLARIHQVDIDAAGLADFGKPGNFLKRQISRWRRQWELSKTRDIPAVDRLIDWLSRNTPDDDRSVVVHGDFRFGNLMFHPVEPHVVAALDWELSTLGDPLADLAHTCMFTWFVTPEEYGGTLGLDMTAHGLPNLDDFVGAYREVAGDQGVLGVFHIVLALFRNAIIFEGIAARAKAGNASSDNAAAVGALASRFAGRADSLISAATLQEALDIAKRSFPG